MTPTPENFDQDLERLDLTAAWAEKKIPANGSIEEHLRGAEKLLAKFLNPNQLAEFRAKCEQQDLPQVAAMIRKFQTEVRLKKLSDVPEMWL